MIGSSGKSHSKYGESTEHDKILGGLENPASKATGQGIRLKYRNAFWSNEAPGKNWRGLIDYDTLIRTKNSTSTELK